MTALDQRSTAELRRLRDRATNETIGELLNAELSERFKQHPATVANSEERTVWDPDGSDRDPWKKKTFYPNPGQP